MLNSASISLLWTNSRIYTGSSFWTWGVFFGNDGVNYMGVKFGMISTFGILLFHPTRGEVRGEWDRYMSKLLYGTSRWHMSNTGSIIFHVLSAWKLILVKTLLRSVFISKNCFKIWNYHSRSDREHAWVVWFHENSRSFYVQSFYSIDFKRMIPFLSVVISFVRCTLTLMQDQSQWSWIICYSIVRIFNGAALFLAGCEFHIEIVHQGCCDYTKYHQGQILTHTTIRSCIGKHQARFSKITFQFWRRWRRQIEWLITSLGGDGLTKRERHVRLFIHCKLWCRGPAFGYEKLGLFERCLDYR